MGVSGQHHAPSRALPLRKGPPPVPIVQEAGWAPEQLWTQAAGKLLSSLPGLSLDRLVVWSVVRHYTG
jgi:hypothetical protein